MKKLFTFLIVTCFLTGASYADFFGVPLPDTQAYTIENFEEGYVWVHAGEDWDRWGDKHVTLGAELWRRWRTDGKYSMHLIYGEQHGDAQSLWYSDYPENETLDVSQYHYIAFDIYNPENIGIVLGLCMQGMEWNWLQSDTWVWFPQGEHTICFDVSNISAEERRRIRRLLIMMPSETKGEGSIFIDNIRGYK